MNLPLRTIILLLIVAALAGCSFKRPDLERLYWESSQVAQPPVILIHGIFGARLSDRVSGKEVWPGSIPSLVFSDYKELALEIDPLTLEPLPSHLQPSGLTDRVAGKDYYGNIIRVLEDAGGYRRAEPGQRVENQQRVYYLFIYDWRQDNVVTVGKLADLIERIQQDHNDPELKVDLVGHSMGGLIARYYLRYGRHDVLNDNEFPVNQSGARNVRRAVLLGTPNLGSVGSLHAFMRGYKVVFNRIPPEALATAPSLYQLFPHNLNEWLLNASGEPLRRDVFEIDVWRRFQWSIFDPNVRQRILDRAATPMDGDASLQVMERFFEKSLERARRFVWSLTVPIPQSPTPLIVFGGDCNPTPAKLLVEEIDGESMIRLWPREVQRPLAGVDYERLMVEPGDGTVTKASLLARASLDPSIPRHRYIDFPLDYTMFLCVQHERMTGNITFQDNLLHTLLSPDSDRKIERFGSSTPQ